MAVVPTTTSDRTEPVEAPSRTCGTCVFCRGGMELMCFWDIVGAVLDCTDVDDADVRLVCAEDEGCMHWRRSRWA